MDPNFITSDLWRSLTSNLMLLWGFAGSVILFAGSLLLAIAVIPSLVGSGHLPSTPPGPAKMVRPLFFFLALVGAAGVAFFLGQLLPEVFNTAADIWDRVAI
ncbi:MAG: hypothetical protein EXR55_02235 [Dehalococcoidia bacterium]|nr:hypothetical protein [Dehalococcoidia bacterium]